MCRDDFERLYEDNFEFLRRGAIDLGSAASAAEDLVQETFLIAHRRRSEFEGRSTARTWLYGILTNVCLNHRRTMRRARRKLDALAEWRSASASSLAVEAHLDAEGLLGERLLNEFLAELDEVGRRTFVAIELEGSRGPELARAMEVNVNTVYARVRAARRAFVDHFEREPKAGSVASPLSVHAA